MNHSFNIGFNKEPGENLARTWRKLRPYKKLIEIFHLYHKHNTITKLIIEPNNIAKQNKMKFNEENLTIDLSDYCENILLNNETYQSVIDLLTWRIEGIDFLYHNHNHYWSDEWIDGLSEYAEEVGADFISDIVLDYMEDLIKELNIFDNIGRKYNCEEKYWIKENYEEYTKFFNEKLKQFKIQKELRKKPIVEIQEPKGEINTDNIIKITGEKSEMPELSDEEIYKKYIEKRFIKFE